MDEGSKEANSNNSSINNFPHDLGIVILWVVLSDVFTLLPVLNETFFSVFFPWTAMLFLPGYVLAAFLFPKKKDLGLIKRFALSFGLSLAITLLLGLCLSFASVEILLVPILLILTFFIFVFCFLAYLKLKDIPEEERFNKNFILSNIIKILSNLRLPQKKLVHETDLRTTFPHDLGIVILWVVLSDVFTLLPVLNETFLRVVFAWTTILFLPGYVLVAFLFPKKEDLGLIERVALSFGLSAAITPLLGLFLNFTPFGIRLLPILLILTFFIFVFCFLAYLKLKNIPEEERFNENFILSGITKISSAVRLPQEKLDKALSIIMFFSVAFCAFTLIFVISVPKQGEKFTEFYILNDKGTANSYPANLTVGEKGIININVVSHEHEKAEYNLLIKVNNETLQEQKISLSHNETWSMDFTFSARDTGTKKLEFLLYKDDEIYRNLHLWVNVIEKRK